jgi:hypothetical protein
MTKHTCRQIIVGAGGKTETPGVRRGFYLNRRTRRHTVGRTKGNPKGLVCHLCGRGITAYIQLVVLDKRPAHRGCARTSEEAGINN